MKIFRVKEWKMCDMLHALKMGDVTNYFFSVCNCSYSITEFFGYYKEDGFIKKKNLGRLEKEPGLWNNIESKWLKLYRERKSLRRNSGHSQKQSCNISSLQCSI